MSLKGDLAFKRKRCYYAEWKVKLFAESPNKGEIWISPAFRFSDATWYLRLFPNGHSSNIFAGWIGLYLVKKKSESKVHEVSFTLGVKTNNDVKHRSAKYTHSFSKPESGFGVGKLLDRKGFILDGKKLFPDGVVTFFCMAHLLEEETGVDAESQTCLQDECSRLNRDLKELFLSEEGADVTIKLKGKEIQAHSQILSARSSVFAPMFRHDTKEKNTGVVEIPEFEPDAFREFLMFLYCEQTEKLSSDNVIDLYCAADKYDVEELKAICYKFMKENMTVDLFCDVFSLAIRYGDKDLIDFLTDYFIKNAKKIVVTLKWISVMKEHLIECNELVVKLTNNLRD